MMKLSDTEECPKCVHEDEKSRTTWDNVPVSPVSLSELKSLEVGGYYLSMTDIFSESSIKSIAAYVRLTKRLEPDRDSFRDSGVT